jgi:hypothetical protein
MRLNLVPIPFQSNNADVPTFPTTHEQARPGQKGTNRTTLGAAQRPDIPIIMGQHFLKHTGCESGVTAASLTRQDDSAAHLFGRHEPTMVHYRLAEQGRFRLFKPVLR